MDGLSALVIAVGALLLVLVAYLGTVDYLEPVPEPRARRFSPRRTSKRHR
jgi:hypothetical protein